VEWSEISKLAWQDSYISYVIKYKPKLETKWDVVNSLKSSVTLKELKPNSNYTFFVCAKNSVGVGCGSEGDFTTNSSKSLFPDDSPYPQ
jgi:hypothetical protein